MKSKLLSIVAITALVMSMGLVNAVDLDNEPEANSYGDAQSSSTGLEFVIAINGNDARCLDIGANLSNRLKAAGHTVTPFIANLDRRCMIITKI